MRRTFLILFLITLSGLNLIAQQVPERKQEGIIRRNAIELITPPYPPLARTAHIQGQVMVEVLIDEQGMVFSAEAVSGPQLLRPAAVGAAKGSRFKQTLLDGVPVKVAGLLTYNFAFDGAPPVPPTELSPVDRSFSIIFPGIGNKVDHPYLSSNLTELANPVLYNLRRTPGEFEIRYMDVVDKPKGQTAEETLVTLIKHFIDYKEMPANDKIINNYGCSGHESYFEFVSNEQGRFRFFLSGNRFYVLSVKSNDLANLKSEDAERFFSSFKIANPECGVAK